MAMACYHYTATLGTPKPGPTFSKLTVAVDGISAAKAKQSLSVGATIGNGANLTRELVNLPATYARRPTSPKRAVRLAASTTSSPYRYSMRKNGQHGYGLAAIGWQRER